jgi:hypothetical protein
MIIIIGEVALVAVVVGLAVIVGGESIVDAIRWTPWEILAIIAAVWIVAFCVVSPLIGYLLMWRQRALGPHLLSLRVEGVRVESPSGQTLIYWSSFRRIVATRQRLYLFLKLRSALIVPRRCFQESAGFEAFVAAAKLQRNQVRT